MSRTLYYRNLFFFVLFVAIVFATPYVFAQSGTSTLIRISHAELSFNEATLSEQGAPNGNFNSQSSQIGEGIVLRFHRDVMENAVVDGNGNIMMYETAMAWNQLARNNPELSPQRINGRLAFPVSIAQDPSGRLQPGTVGYIPIAELFHPDSFQALRFSEQPTSEAQFFSQAPQGLNQDELFNFFGANQNPSSASDQTEVIDEEVSQGGGETTVTLGSETTAPESSMFPQARPEFANPFAGVGPVDAPSLADGFMCRLTEYVSSISSYQSRNCFTENDMDTREAAEHLMGDIMAINQLRDDGADIDPRYSLCTSARETGMSFAPHVRGPTNDFGMYQLLPGTIADALNHGYDMIAPGFEDITRGSQASTAQARMVNQPLAQADLHHMIVLRKLDIQNTRTPGIRDRFEAGRATIEDYRTLAGRYNGAGRNSTYANRIVDCYQNIQGLITPDGRVREGVTNSQLRQQLARACNYRNGRSVCLPGS
jgi:hypothetical protein